MTLRWLFLDLNSYFASVEQAINPALMGKPVAVVPMMAETTCCLAASYPAKKFGVKTGTSVRDARKLCPGIVFIQAEHRRYTEYHRRIVATVEKHMPISKILSIDEMACELIGRERCEDFARLKAREIKDAIYKEISPALTCSIGVAPNSYLAKVASDMQKPDGLTIIHLHEIEERLSGLVPRDFPGVGPRMEERFIKRRCLSAKKMYEFSVSDMREIWGGVVGERFWHLIRGENLEDRETTRASISHSKVLAPDKRERHAVWPIAVRLLSKACMRLRDEDFYTKELWLSVKFVERDKDLKHWHSHARIFETQDSITLIKELEKLWQQMPHGKILRVGLALSQLVPVTKHQLSLFEDPKREKLMNAIDQINKNSRSNLVYVGDSHDFKDNAAAAIAFQRIPKEYE
jgi:DNA polymerase IV